MEVILGTIVSTFGIKGELKVHPNTDFASKRYKVGNKVKVYSPARKVSEFLTVNSYKHVKNVDVVSFKEYNTPEDVTKFINYQVLCEIDNDKLEKNTFHYASLWHCKVYHNDKCIGEVDDIISTTSSIVLRIKRENQKDLLYPFIERFIKSVDIDKKEIILNPIEGMLDL